MAQAIETVIIGGGQAGLSTSYFLTAAGRENLVLERSSLPGSAWRSHRWDSFTLVTPNWTFQLPGAEYKGSDPNGYMHRNEIAQRFDAYVADYHLPVAYNTTVTQVEPYSDGTYHVQTAQETYTARNVVVANGFFQEGRLPDYTRKLPDSITQLHSGSYRNPQSLPDGAVLVVGTGQSGMQIAEEIYQNGRKVYLATSGAARAPRRYRGKDIFEWLEKTGFFEQTFEQFFANGRRKHVPPHLTGKDGGHNLNLHQFYRDGVTLLGHARGYEEGNLILADDLQENLRISETGEKMLLQRIDQFIQSSGLDIAPEPLTALIDAYQAPQCTSLNLQQEGINTIIWACGYQYNSEILRFPVRNEFGLPDTQRGVSRYPGLYFIGIPFFPKMKSGFLFGVAEDAAYIAEHIINRA